MLMIIRDESGIIVLIKSFTNYMDLLHYARDYGIRKFEIR